MDPMDRSKPPPYMDDGMRSPVYTQQPGPANHPSQPLSTTTTVVLSPTAGGCPVCHNNSWSSTYSCCAWLLCLFCFPCGIICCCCMKKKKCSKCGFIVG